ncbi:unnamed protein product [Penicillium glandicola]
MATTREASQLLTIPGEIPQFLPRRSSRIAALQARKAELEAASMRGEPSQSCSSHLELDPGPNLACSKCEGALCNNCSLAIDDCVKKLDELHVGVYHALKLTENGCKKEIRNILRENKKWTHATMGDQNIPESFLRGPALNATLRKLDFEHTSPPIPLYKGHFAAIVDNFMTEAECKELIRLAEESTRTQLPDSTLSPPVWEQAMVNAGGGKQVMSIDSRKSGRVILDSPDLADRILKRIMPFMRECELDRIQGQPKVTGFGPVRRGEVLRLSRLNERLRFLRYEGGDYFRPHWDGCFVTPDGLEKSLYTIQMYLNGDGEQDMEELKPHIEQAEKSNWIFAKDWQTELARLEAESEVEPENTHLTDQSCTSAVESSRKTGALLGGSTSFMAEINSRELLRIFPKTGSILIFQQRNMLHGGDDVFRGVKYTLRTDVMYATE